MPVANSHLFNPSLTGPRKRITQDVDLSVRATFRKTPKAGSGVYRRNVRG